VRGPQFVPPQGAGLVRPGGAAGSSAPGRERPVRPLSVHRERRDERRPQGRVNRMIVIARHQHHSPGGVGQVSAKRRTCGTRAAHRHPMPGPNGRIQHRQAPPALQQDPVDQRPSQMLPPVPEAEPGDRPVQRRVPQRPLLARTEVGQQDGGAEWISNSRELDHLSLGKPDQPRQPRDRAPRGEQIHLDPPPTLLGQRRDKEPMA